MSILDQSLEFGSKGYPTQDEEFVLLHIDSVESSGFISHLKLPHYVTFQSKLDSMRKIRKARARCRRDRKRSLKNNAAYKPISLYLMKVPKKKFVELF